MNFWQFLPLSYLAVVTIPLVVTDVRVHRLPNLWVIPGYAVVLLAWVGDAITTGRIPWVSMVCAVGYFFFMFAMAWFGGMGMGDVKLAGVIGAAAGFVSGETAVASVALAFFVGGLVSLGVLSADRVRRARSGANVREKLRSSRRIAFGPFILLGFWISAGFHVLA